MGGLVELIQVGRLGEERIKRERERERERERRREEDKKWEWKRMGEGMSLQQRSR